MKRVFVLVTRHLSPVTFLLVTACRAIALATAGHLSLITSVIAAEPPITEAELVRRTQELYDSIVSGNQTPWKKYFADDCTFSDEKGRTLDKTKLVADITPLPKGYSGAIKIENVISRIIGDTAILSYDANETETIFGQNLRARYHVTDTWLRRKVEWSDRDERHGRQSRKGTRSSDAGAAEIQWQIIASQAHRYYEDPAIGKADGKKFPDFVGSYELAPGQTRMVSVEGENLIIERNGKKQQLFPETSEIFFRKGIEGRILFHYDANGKADALIDRRNNEDVIWKKTK
jgi:Domain of unknown function (DUF4440)/Domain of unknown function (DUF3471)